MVAFIRNTFIFICYQKARMRWTHLQTESTPLVLVYIKARDENGSTRLLRLWVAQGR